MINIVDFNVFLRLTKENPNIKVVVYGASYEVTPLVEALAIMKININFFCDRDVRKIGSNIKGIPILSPEKLFNEDEPWYIIISANTMHHSSIIEKLDGLFITATVSFPAVLEYPEGSVSGYDAFVVDPLKWLQSRPYHSDICFENSRHYMSDFDGFAKWCFRVPTTRILEDCIVHNDLKTQYFNIINGFRMTTDAPVGFKSSVYFLGDSTVLGVGVDDESTICSFLQRKLNESFSEKKFKVHNCGVVGSSIMNMISIVKNLPLVKDDIVLLSSGRMDSVEQYTDMGDSLRPYVFFAFLKDVFLYCKSLGVSCVFVSMPTFFLLPELLMGDCERFLLKKNFQGGLLRSERQLKDRILYKCVQAYCSRFGIPFVDVLSDIIDKAIPNGFFLDPVHFSPKGCESIAIVMFDFIKRFVNYDVVDNCDFFDLVSQTKDKLLRSEKKSNAHRLVFEDKKFDLFLKSISELKKNKNKLACNGCIVMNCNPFTSGHLYLIETASAQVDNLYIFVVKEDRSVFAFQDRYNMVLAGTRHLKNVMVHESGEYIISSRTFPEYFSKDDLQSSTIDASLDILIFATRIAPALDISVRFVGEEPFCKVTDSYNQQMKILLEKYGITLKILPRKENDGVPISASEVRRLLNGGYYDQVKKIVPETTYDILLRYSKYNK